MFALFAGFDPYAPFRPRDAYVGVFPSLDEAKEYALAVRAAELRGHGMERQIIDLDTGAAWDWTMGGWEISDGEFG